MIGGAAAEQRTHMAGYAEPLLDALDPERRLFSARLYRCARSSYRMRCPLSAGYAVGACAAYAHSVAWSSWPTRCPELSLRGV